MVLNGSTQTLIQARDLAFKIGDIYRAFFAMNMVLIMGIYSEYRLTEYEVELRHAQQVANDYKNHRFFLLAQLSECLRGRSAHLPHFSGSWDSITSGNEEDEYRVWFQTCRVLLP